MKSPNPVSLISAMNPSNPNPEVTEDNEKVNNDEHEGGVSSVFEKYDVGEPKETREGLSSVYEYDKDNEQSREEQKTRSKSVIDDP